jgi:hypothetical protein
VNALEPNPTPPWQRLQRGALTSGGVALALCFVATFLDVEQVCRSYLIAYTFWLGIALGCLAIWMIHNLTGGYWGLALRRLLEAGSRTLWLLAILFLPIALGLEHIYVWASGEAAHEPALQQKIEMYLNVPFFLGRAVFYFAAWLLVAYLLNRWSAAHDREPNPLVARRAQVVSGPGLALYGLTVTFAAIDWIMSLEPEWYSTIFGALIGTSQVLAALALTIAALAWLATREPPVVTITVGVWNDLGNLLLAFVMLWTYMSFSQLLLIWSGNLPEEITWYEKRIEGGWEVIAVLLALLYFALPFLFLLMRPIKRDPRIIGKLALVLVVMSCVHQFWLIAPAFSPSRLRLHWLDPLTFLGVGGMWTAEFLRQLGARPLTPPLVIEAVAEASHA